MSLEVLTREIIAASFKAAAADHMHPSVWSAPILLGRAPLLLQEPAHSYYMHYCFPSASVMV